MKIKTKKGVVGGDGGRMGEVGKQSILISTKMQHSFATGRRPGLPGPPRRRRHRGGAAGGGGGREGAGISCCSARTAGWRHGKESKHLPTGDFLEQPKLESGGKEENKSGVTAVDSKKAFFVLRERE